jgi:predicted small metal-binding protein
MAICTSCGKPFRSDDRNKVINRVVNHYKDKHK